MVSAPALADEVDEFAVFRGYDDSSTYSVSYEDLSLLLNNAVFDTGRSTRKLAEPPPDITGTRMKSKVNRLTEGEGNRFFFESFKDNEDGKNFLRSIQQSLEQLPDDMPLDQFSREEQLAYWLNLYNVTVLNEIIAVYPKRNLKRLTIGKRAFFDEKTLTVAGVPLSLNDIHFNILMPNYDNDPRIIYGLYQGIVGGPDIRSTAFSGSDVYRALEDNADEFINSNRGTFSRSKGAYRVSSLYGRNKAYFPDFEADLSRHLLEFLEGDERARLEAATAIKPDINDWTVTDLGVSRHGIGGSLAHNNAALLDAYRGNERSVYGGVRIASLEVKRELPDPEEDEVKLEDLQRFPVEGGNVEDIATTDESSDQEPSD